MAIVKLKHMKPFFKFSKKQVTIKTDESVYIIPFDDILFCESSMQYTIFFKTNGSSERIKLSLLDVEKQLNGMSFWSTSKKHLVNLKYLDRVPSNNETVILLNNHIKIPIDEDRKQLLINELTKLQ